MNRQGVVEFRLMEQPTEGLKEGPTVPQTDRPTDKVGCRDACTLQNSHAQTVFLPSIKRLIAFQNCKKKEVFFAFCKRWFILDFFCPESIMPNFIQGPALSAFLQSTSTLSFNFIAIASAPFTHIAAFPISWFSLFTHAHLIYPIARVLSPP